MRPKLDFNILLDYNLLASILLGEWRTYCADNQLTQEESADLCRHLGKITLFVQHGVVHRQQVRVLLSKLHTGGRTPGYWIKALGLRLLTNDEPMHQAVCDVLNENPELVEQYCAGRTQLLDVLMGKVMALGRGNFPPARARELLIQYLYQLPKSCS